MRLEGRENKGNKWMWREGRGGKGRSEGKVTRKKEKREGGEERGRWKGERGWSHLISQQAQSPTFSVFQD
jgi:hypothetical protein